MRIKKLLIFLIFSFTSTLLCSQQVFESGIIYGGVTGGGFSTNTGSGTVTTNVSIPQNSTIKKAFLLATRNNEAPNITIDLNGLSYNFTDYTVVSNYFISANTSSFSWNKSSIHSIDITNNIDSSITMYNLTVPPQINQVVNGYYSSFYLYII